MFAAAAVVSGAIVHALFSVAGLLPRSAKNIKDLAAFTVDYTLFLNFFALAVSVVLVYLWRQEATNRS